jgi:hypothetical protein
MKRKRGKIEDMGPSLPTLYSKFHSNMNKKRKFEI